MDELERYRTRIAARHRALRRLGVHNVQCICGETDPHCFEVEHLERRKNSDVVWGTCKNCHAKITVHQVTEHPEIAFAGSNPIERAGHALLGMVEYLEAITTRLRQIAELLFKLVEMGVYVED